MNATSDKTSGNFGYYLIFMTVLTFTWIYLTAFSFNPQDINVTGGRAYVSNLSLSPADGSAPISVGPVLITGIFSESRLTLSVPNVPEGSYNKVYLIISPKPPDLYDATLPNNRSFAFYGSFNKSDFLFSSDAVVSKTIMLDSAVTVAKNSNAMAIVLNNVDINQAFMDSGVLLDPSDPKNSKTIEKNLNRLFMNSLEHYK